MVNVLPPPTALYSAKSGFLEILLAEFPKII